MGSTRTQIENIRRERGALVMAVVNCTPDSFFDGGRHVNPADAIARIDRILEEGADIVDIGGESTRPGSTPVPADEQIRRVDPALRHALARGAIVSVDTTSPRVARHALALGARIVNDVSCLADAELAHAVADHEATLLVMHSRGSMHDMPSFSEWPDEDYADVVAEVLDEWTGARVRAVGAGVREEDVWLDPGIGFAKNARQSLELFARLPELCAVGAPVVVGPGRKSFIASVHASLPEDRLGGTIAAAVVAAQRGAAVIRVHDVLAVRQALAVARAMSAPRSQAAAHA